MTARVFKATVFTLALLATLSFSGMAVAQSAKTMAKEDIEKIVHDYILANPQVILETVSNYQKKSMQERQSGALAKSQAALHNDEGSPVVGNPDGDITVVEFMDYNCHFCKQAFTNLKSLMDSDKKVRVVFKDYPVLGPSSELAAKWALAADKQKKYFDYHKALMNSKSPMSEEVLESIAKEVGLDVAKLKKDAEGTEVAAQIEKNRALGGSLDINGTPAFIIGDEVIPGAVSVDVMKKTVSEQRAKKAKK